MRVCLPATKRRRAARAPNCPWQRTAGWNVVDEDDFEPADEDSDEEEEPAPHHVLDPAWWREFGADLEDDDEPDPEPGDFWPEQDEPFAALPGQDGSPHHRFLFCHRPAGAWAGNSVENIED